jgi:hypothetical protein
MEIEEDVVYEYLMVYTITTPHDSRLLYIHCVYIKWNYIKLK